MPHKIYTIVIDGKPQGPFALDELKDLAIHPNCFIKKPGMDDYKEAHDFPEIRELFGFAKQYTAPQYFAGFDLRLLASCLDWFLIICVVLAIELLVASASDSGADVIALSPYNLILLPVVKFVYHIVSETLMQATIGKRLLNIKVTDLNGLKPLFNQILIRNLSKIVSSLMLFIGYLYSFLNKKHQCLHDVFANTLVIKDRLI